MRACWALDLETSGLDEKKDAIVAVGMVPIRDGAIRVGEAFESLVRVPLVRTTAVRVHQIVPRELENAPGLAEVLEEIDRRLQGGVLLVHQAAIDVRFLRRAHRDLGLRWPKVEIVDTVDLLGAAERRSRFIDPSAVDGDPVVNLAAARRRLGLPEYPAHDALTDAISTAELFLVLGGAARLRT